MIKSIFKAILGGFLLGTLAFYAAHLFFALLFFGLLMAIFARRRFGRNGFAEHKLAFASHVRNMNEEEYEAFKKRMETPQNHCSNYCC